MLFVTQFPVPSDFAAIGSTFGNHFPGVLRAGRGGDLWILYPDGSLCNLTREAGYGDAGAFQGADAIAVRDPYVHPDGQRALFSMVVGAPAGQYDADDGRWQLYEVTGLAQGASLQITKVADQPEDYNNLTPIYAPDGRIVFTSDRPRDGRAHLYPQLDEYESTPTNSGLWALDPASGELVILSHSPSGVFSPTVDSFGRILFTRWDHLQTDQQAEPGGAASAFDWTSEEKNAPIVAAVDVFPEPRFAAPASNVNDLRMNHFFPWQIRADGTEEETLNHIGRHELHDFFTRSFTDDAGLADFAAGVSGRVNGNDIENFFYLAEDPNQAGRYLGVDAPEFQTHGAGVVLRLAMPPGQAPDAEPVEFLTHPDTRTATATPSPNHSGHYRDPEVLSDGTILAAHALETGVAANLGTQLQPDASYDFRLRRLESAGNGYLAGTTALTQGLSRSVQMWTPDELLTYSGPFWELQPVAVRTRSAPPVLGHPAIEAPEASVFAAEQVGVGELRGWLEREGLALIVSRDVTKRDALDRQQPFNLRVVGGTAQTTADAGILYDIEYMQIFQADQVRGVSFGGVPRAGRRPLARPMHDPSLVGLSATGPEGSVDLGTDGSMAALVPARRALSWQLTDDDEPVVRERYWLTMQPGEIRVCPACHGLSSQDQTGAGTPTNQPEALASLLALWREEVRNVFEDGFESGNVSAWSQSSGD